MSWRSVLGCLAACLLAAGEAGGSDETSTQPPRFAYFGDLHVHTMYSLDAFRSRSVRAAPDDAYRYAKGEAIPHPRGGPDLKLTTPLDFLAVTDHAEWLGVALATRPVSMESPTGYRLTRASRHALGTVIRSRQLEGVVREAWRRTIAAAERHNAPDEFTAFVGYEYTAQGRMLHRNVIFRSAEVPQLPFSSLQSQDPEDLWDWLDDQRRRGVDALAIPHKMDRSGGRAFPEENTWQGVPIDRAFAEKRKRNEPLAEVVQEKGVSETHPSLSPTDEWAGFGLFRFYDGPTPLGGYWRQGLGAGLVIEQRVGVNPYRVGAAGGSDTHLGAGTFEEARYFTGATAKQRQDRLAARAAGVGPAKTHRRSSFGTAGLTGIWAERNTRDALFDAMRRRETFATSGPRLRVRLFAGYGLAEKLREADDPVAAGYRHGVPMGGVIAGKGGAAPSFYLWALRDPNAGRLQRLQVVKGWLREGEAMEQVFDVACSDGLGPAADHRCPDNGAGVDLADCSTTPGKGDPALSASWRDPGFDPTAPSYYYLRALENPSCRWSTWDAVRAGVAPNPVLPPTIQERAWSSPIWYVPAAAAAGGAETGELAYAR